VNTTRKKLEKDQMKTIANNKGVIVP